MGESVARTLGGKAGEIAFYCILYLTSSILILVKMVLRWNSGFVIRNWRCSVRVKRNTWEVCSLIILPSFLLLNLTHLRANTHTHTHTHTDISQALTYAFTLIFLHLNIIAIVNVSEGQEPAEFWSFLGGKGPYPATSKGYDCCPVLICLDSSYTIPSNPSYPCAPLPCPAMPFHTVYCYLPHCSTLKFYDCMMLS